MQPAFDHLGDIAVVMGADRLGPTVQHLFIVFGVDENCGPLFGYDAELIAF